MVPPQPGLSHHLRKHLERRHDTDHRPLVIARAPAMHGAAFEVRREVGRHHINMRVERHGLAFVPHPCSGDYVQKVAPVGVSCFRRETLRAPGGLGEMQQGIIRVALDGRVDRTALKERAWESERAQLPLQDTKALTFRRLHLPRVGLRGRVNAAELDQ